METHGQWVERVSGREAIEEQHMSYLSAMLLHKPNGLKNGVSLHEQDKLQLVAHLQYYETSLLQYLDMMESASSVYLQKLLGHVHTEYPIVTRLSYELQQTVLRVREITEGRVNVRRNERLHSHLLHCHKQQ